MQTTNNLFLLVGLLTALVCSPAFAEKVLIRSPKPYDKIVKEVQKQGGKVTHQYKYVDLIAADVPDATLKTIRGQLPVGAVTKDFEVNVPTVPTDPRGNRLLAEVAATSRGALSAAAIKAQASANPNAYVISLANMNVLPLFADGNWGQEIKVAVIDSGIRPGFPHIEYDGSVIGGEDFVGDGLSFNNFANNGHGTFVAGMISANMVFEFPPTSAFLNAVKTYCPSCVDGNFIPMLGSAPLSSIYSLRVFPPEGGAPESVVIAAMERVLQLRENFDNGMPETQNPDGSFAALNIKVCNMSLGGPTLYAGRDIEDQLTQVFQQRDIVLTVSAGNAGPSGTTGGGPGTGPGALTVGASSDAIYERILIDLIYNSPGLGPLYRPFNGTQTAYFSSRGPTADGRIGPDLVANGFASFGQGYGETVVGIDLASGTSFSSPSVAGVAAVLRQASPSSTARQIRNALIQTANPALIQDGSGPLDRGNGHVDAGAALALLQSGGASDAPGLPGGHNSSVKENIQHGAGIKTYDGKITRTASGLQPGERFETYYRVTPNTGAVVVDLSGFTAGPPASQNQIFGDNILLTVHSAKTSSIGDGDYPVSAFTTGGTFVINDPEEGLMRVTLNGDWTNAGEVGATVTIFSLKEKLPGKTAKDKIQDGDLQVVPFKVPVGAASLSALLRWDGDWDSYPTNNLDMYLIDPDNNANLDGAALNCPERAEIANPLAGDWAALIVGLSINTKHGDNYELRVAVDGKVLK